MKTGFLFPQTKLTVGLAIVWAQTVVKVAENVAYNVSLNRHHVQERLALTVNSAGEEVVKQHFAVSRSSKNSSKSLHKNDRFVLPAHVVVERELYQQLKLLEHRKHDFDDEEVVESWKLLVNYHYCTNLHRPYVDR